MQITLIFWFWFLLILIFSKNNWIFTDSKNFQIRRYSLNLLEHKFKLEHGTIGTHFFIKIENLFGFILRKNSNSLCCFI